VRFVDDDEIPRVRRHRAKHFGLFDEID